MKVWNQETRKIKDLIPYSRNPRIISAERLEKLKERITSQGFRNPVCLDRDNTILAGHQRIKALIDLGLGDMTIPVMTPPEGLELTEALIREIVATDNISWGEFDTDILSEDNTFEELKDWGFLDLKEPDEEIEIKEDELPEIEEKVISKQGDLWILGNHRLLCGDSTNIDDVEKLMGGGRG
jgi:ParB-like chromosome segregation protein Spo0J